MQGSKFELGMRRSSRQATAGATAAQLSDGEASTPALRRGAGSTATFFTQAWNTCRHCSAPSIFTSGDEIYCMSRNAPSVPPNFDTVMGL